MNSNINLKKSVILYKKKCNKYNTFDVFLTLKVYNQIKSEESVASLYSSGCLFKYRILYGEYKIKRKFIVIFFFISSPYLLKSA